MNKRENIEAQDLQQRHSQVSESFGEFHAHEVGVELITRIRILRLFLSIAASSNAPKCWAQEASRAKCDTGMWS